MAQLIVQKYGGSSVADPEKIKNVARRVAESARDGHRMVVVVSAMGKTTDGLLALASAITPTPDPREMDLLMSTGEQVTIGLIAMALQRSDTPRAPSPAADWPHHRRAHTLARIKDIDAERIHAALDAGRVAIVAGFQGVTEAGDITTLGRGGSDLTASRWPPRSRPTCARSTPTWTASTPPIPTCARRAQAGPHLLRRDDRDRRAGRQGAPGPLGRVRQEIQRPCPRPLDLQADPGTMVTRRIQHGIRHGDRRHPRPGSGQGHDPAHARPPGVASRVFTASARRKSWST